MKKIYQLTFILLALCMGSMLQAQTDDDNFIFRINSPPSIAGEYNASGTVDFGPSFTEDIMGEMAWSFDSVDSLNCISTSTTDLTGKFGMARRGDCSFSLKIYNVQSGGAAMAIICNNDEAAPDAVVGMLGADSMNAVTIPAIFLSFNTCNLIAMEISAGRTVDAEVILPSLINPVSYIHYETPQEQILPLEFMGVTVVNQSLVPALGVTVERSIMEPDGNVLTDMEEIPLLDPGASMAVTFPVYTPSDMGEYQVRYSSNLSVDFSPIQPFVIGEHSFTHDEHVVDGGVQVSEEGFEDALFRYDIGNGYYTGPSGATATHMSFSVQNAAELFADAAANGGTPEFEIRVYDMDPQGLMNWNTAVCDYNEFQSVFIDFVALDEDSQNGETIFVEFAAPITLKPNGLYLVNVQYDGSLAYSTVVPNYTVGGNIVNFGPGTYPPISTAVWAFGDCNGNMVPRWFSGGFVGNPKADVRLHLDGFIVATKDLPTLTDQQARVFPNPANTHLNLYLNLDESNVEVQYHIMDINGRVIQADKFISTENGVHPVDINDLTSGHYFIGIITEKGFRNVQFTKVD